MHALTFCPWEHDVPTCSQASPRACDGRVLESALTLLSITSGRDSNLSDAALVESLRAELLLSKEAAGSQMTVIAELKATVSKVQSERDDALRLNLELEKSNATWEQRVRLAPNLRTRTRARAHVPHVHAHAHAQAHAQAHTRLARAHTRARA